MLTFVCNWFGDFTIFNRFHTRTILICKNVYKIVDIVFLLAYYTTILVVYSGCY
jgi:hypothetical protein